MFKVVLFLLGLGLVCVANEIKPEAKAPEKPQPFLIQAPPPTLAEVDPKTLKVTYHKGSDPKQIVDVLLHEVAGLQGQLKACSEQLKSKDK